MCAAPLLGSTGVRRAVVNPVVDYEFYDSRPGQTYEVIGVTGRNQVGTMSSTRRRAGTCLLFTPRLLRALTKHV